MQQAGLAQEIKQMLDDWARKDSALVARFEPEAKEFFLAYFKEVARVFATAWDGKKYSIKSTMALRAFLQIAPEVLARALTAGGTSRADALRTVLAPWAERIGSGRFETAGAWRAKDRRRRQGNRRACSRASWSRRSGVPHEPGRGTARHRARERRRSCHLCTQALRTRLPARAGLASAGS